MKTSFTVKKSNNRKNNKCIGKGDEKLWKDYIGK